MHSKQIFLLSAIEVQKQQMSYCEGCFQLEEMGGGKIYTCFLGKKAANSKSNKTGGNKNVAFSFVNKKRKAHAD